MSLSHLNKNNKLEEIKKTDSEQKKISSQQQLNNTMDLETKDILDRWEKFHREPKMVWFSTKRKIGRLQQKIYTEQYTHTNDPEGTRQKEIAQALLESHKKKNIEFFRKYVKPGIENSKKYTVNNEKTFKK